MARRTQDGDGCAWLILIVVALFVLSKCGGDDGGPGGSDSSGNWGSPQQAATTPRYVTASSLNCRGQPEAASAVVTKLTRAELVSAREEVGTWTRISSPLHDCWVASRYLAADKPEVHSRKVAFAETRPARAAKPKRSAKSRIVSSIIADSIDAYPGNCPCPYNTDRAGRRCGGRSAYSRGGGYAPLCYPDDVSEADIAAYRG